MKKLLVGLLVLVVLVIGGLLAAPFLIPVETYTRQVQAQVEAATGRTLTIEGPVDLQLLPSVALDAESVRLANVSGAAEADMVRLKGLEAELKVLPLLRGSVEIARFVLIEPEIHLEVDEQGVANWQFGTVEGSAPGDDAPDGAGAPADGAGGGGLPISELKLGEIRIEDGTVTFRDRASGVNERFENIDLSLDLPDLRSRLEAEGSLDYKERTIQIGLGLAKPMAVMEGGSSGLTANIEAEPVALTFAGEVEGGGAPGARGALDLDIKAIRELMAWLAQPLDLAGEGVQSLAIAGQLEASPTRVAFNDASIVFDEIQAEGQVSADLSGRVPAITGRLEVGEVDLAPYLPEPAEDEDGGDASEAAGTGPATGDGGQAPGGWSDEPIPIPTLDMAELDFELALDKLLIRDLELDRTELVLALHDAALDAELREFGLYGGSGQGSFRLDTAPDVPAIDAAFQLQGLQALPFLTAAADFERLEGTAKANFDVRTRGRSQRALVEALAGQGEVMFEDGAIVGINLAQMVRNIGAAFSGADAGVQKTDFAQLGGSFTIDRGVVRNDDLVLQAPVLRLAGSGTVNLPRRTVDYRVEPKAAATLEGQGGEQDVAGILVPVNVEGTFDDLKFRPDLAAALGSAGATGEAVKQQIKRLEDREDELKEAAEQAKQQLEDAAKGGDVKGLVEGASGLLGGRKQQDGGTTATDEGDGAGSSPEQLLKGLFRN